MLTAVLADIFRSIRHRGTEVQAAAALSHPGQHFTVGLERVLQIPTVSQNAQRILDACTEVEHANRYLPSSYKGVLEYKRFQVYMLRDERSVAIDHLRAAVAQVPYNAEFVAAYKKLIPVGNHDSDVVLVVSCKKYERKALELAVQFERAAIEFWIVSGADTKPLDHARAIQVQVPDNYENLPRKVAAAYRWVYENIGSNIGVVKVDDDQTLSDANTFRAQAAALHSRDVYAGVPVSGLTHDRNWHWNKCQDPILNKRTYGRPFFAKWAMGGAYYLGPTALEKVVLFLLRFPGMFEGEYYEDKLIGDILCLEGAELFPLTGYQEFGMALREQHRFNSI